MKHRISYDAAKVIYDQWVLEQEKREKVYLRPFQKSMICPECLKLYSKKEKVCYSCPDESVRAENAKIDRKLKRMGLIR